MTIEAIVQAHPVPDAALDTLRVTEPFREKLRSAWNAFRGPVEDTSDFEIYEELHYSRQGFVESFVRYDGELHVGVRVSDEEADDEELLEITQHTLETLRVSVPADGGPVLDAAFLDSLWVAMEAVSTLKAEKRVGPNDKCSCNSGKKFKKCCGR
jgi:hypothetical protein